MQNSMRRRKKLKRASAVLILTALCVSCAPNSPAYAASEAEVWKTQDGSVAMTPQAARELLTEVRTLRAERDTLQKCLLDEREQTSLLIAEIQEFREQVRLEREASQAMTLELKAELRRQKARTTTIGILGAAGMILCLALR